MENAADILFLSNVTFGKKARILRISRDLRQTDVAYLATQKLHTSGFPHLKVIPADIGYLENDWQINPRKLKAICSVLGLEVPDGR